MEILLATKKKVKSKIYVSYNETVAPSLCYVIN